MSNSPSTTQVDLVLSLKDLHESQDAEVTQFSAVIVPDGGLQAWLTVLGGQVHFFLACAKGKLILCFKMKHGPPL